MVKMIFSALFGSTFDAIGLEILPNWSNGQNLNLSSLQFRWDCQEGNTQ